MFACLWERPGREEKLMVRTEIREVQEQHPLVGERWIWDTHVRNDIGQEHRQFISATREEAMSTGTEAHGQEDEPKEACRNSLKTSIFSARSLAEI